MLSLNDEPNLQQTARNAGINAFLLKPVSPDALCQRILQLTRNPTPFVRSATYIGPERRVSTDPYFGPERRHAET
jgi:DNA-binding NarL/FixJ family response regulator